MRALPLAAAAALGASAMLTSLVTPAIADAQGGGKHPVHGWAHLTGDQEVPPEDPESGDRNGEGRLRYVIKHGKFCYKLSVERVQRPTAAHIHVGEAGENGPVIVTLKTPPSRNSTVRDCIQARSWQNPENDERVLTYWELEGIKKDPFLFYANVHSERFPNGAVRGQLMSRR